MASTKDDHDWGHESHRTLRDGSFGVALSQALRARLRSHRPSGKFRKGFNYRARLRRQINKACLRGPLRWDNPKKRRLRNSILPESKGSDQFSKEKIRFQSFFMLMTNQPFFFASS
jgi:hypothetical protein